MMKKSNESYGRIPILAVLLSLAGVCVARGENVVVNGDFSAPFPGNVSQFIPHWLHYGTSTSRVAVVEDADHGRVLRLTMGVHQGSSFREMDPERDYRLSAWVRAENATLQVRFRNEPLPWPDAPDAPVFGWTRMEIPLPAEGRIVNRPGSSLNLLDMHLVGRPLGPDGAVYLADVRIEPEDERDVPGANLVVNGGFNRQAPLIFHPEGWWLNDHPNQGHSVYGTAEVALDPAQVKSGSASIRVRGRHSPARLRQRVELEPLREQGIRFVRVSAWARCAGLEPYATAEVHAGDVRSVQPFIRLYGDTDWTYGEELFDLRYFPERFLEVGLHLPAATAGTAWMDDVRVEAVEGVPPHNLLPNTRFGLRSIHPRIPDFWGFNRWGGAGFMDLGLHVFSLDDTVTPPLPGVGVLRLHEPVLDPRPNQAGWVVYLMGNRRKVDADESLTLTFSAYLKAAEPETRVRLAGAGLRSMETFTVGTDWTRVSHTYGAAREGFWGKPEVENVALHLLKPGDTVWIAAPQLEIREEAGPYVVGSPEANVAENALRKPPFPDPNTPDPADPFKDLAWRIPEPRLALQPDGSLTFFGTWHGDASLRGQSLSMRIAFPHQDASGLTDLVFTGRERPVPLRIDGIRIPPHPPEHMDVAVSLLVDGNDTPQTVSLPVALCLQDIHAAREPLRAYAEYDTLTDDDRLRVRAEWRIDQPAVLTFRLIDPHGNGLSDAVEVTLSGRKTTDAGLPLAGIADGDLVVQVTARSGERTFRIEDRVRKLPTPGHVVSRVNRFTRCLEVDGEPFLPTFLPNRLERLDDAMLEQLHAAGFNALSGGIENVALSAIHESGVPSDWVTSARQRLDRLLAAGMRTAYPISWDWPLREWFDQRSIFDGDAESLFRAMTQVVEALRDHPAVIGWYMLDEMNPGHWEERFGYALEDMRRMHERIKTADPYRPAYHNWNNTWPGEPYGGIASTDILHHDDYSISRRPLFDLDDLVAATRMINNDVVGRRPGWIWTSGSYASASEPPPHAVWVHGWLHLVYGTRGIGYWSTQPMNPETWTVMQTLNREATALVHDIVGHRNARHIRTAVHNGRVHYTVWETDTGLVVFGVNTGPYAVPMQLDLADLSELADHAVVSARDWASGDSVEISHGVLQTIVPAFERCVVVLSPRQGRSVDDYGRRERKTSSDSQSSIVIVARNR